MKRKLSNSILLTILLTFCLSSFGQKTYLVSVGLNNYDNNENPLPCSREDATSIARFFKSYNNSDVFMLLDGNATRSHILKVLKNQFSKAGPEDAIIFAFSGHGFDGGLNCYDTRNTVYFSEIQNIMNASPARRKVMFVNSCHSGSFSKRNGKVHDYRNASSRVMLFFSSRAEEYSWESGMMSRSFFYHHLLNGLKGGADRNGDGKVTARELFNYVSKGVLKDTEGTQHPQMFGRFPDDMVVVSTPVSRRNGKGRTESSKKNYRNRKWPL